MRQGTFQIVSRTGEALAGIDVNATLRMRAGGLHSGFV